MIKASAVVESTARTITYCVVELLGTEPLELQPFLLSEIGPWLRYDAEDNLAASLATLKALTELQGMKDIKKDLGMQLELRTTVFASLRLASRILSTELQWKPPSQPAAASSPVKSLSLECSPPSA